MTSGDQSQGGRAQDEILAGEYVLGVLSIERRQRVEQRMASDTAFAQIVGRWQRDLSSFNDDYEELVPAPVVFRKIERRLFGAEAATARPVGVWQSVRLWRWVSLGTSALALVALVYASGLVPARRPAGQMVAELSSPNAQVDLVASYDAGSGKMQLVPVAAGRAEKKSLELWVVPAAGNPMSLGILPEEGGGEMVIPADMRSRMTEGATLAVSLEPFGGSPSGLPTGPIVASGAARPL